MIVASVVTFIWLILLLIPDRPWRMREALCSKSEATSGQRVTVLIPARNEEQVLPRNLDALANQRVPMQILVLNDGSTDRTREVALEARLHNLEVLDIPRLPPDWTGKLWALEQGFGRANGDWVLLLDADIALAPGMLPTLLATADREDLDFISIMASPARCGFWDRWLMPVFIYFFKWLYPFHRANDPDSRIAAAAGGCVLVRRGVLVAIGGFSALRDAVIDDCTLAKLAKKQGYRLWIGVSHSVVMLRDHSFRDIWHMVARTAFTQLHYSYLALVVAMVGLGLVFEAPLLLFLSGPGIVRLMAGSAWLLMALSYVPTTRYYDESPLWGFLLPIAAFLFFLMSVHSALRYASGTRTQWKGRSYRQTRS